MISSVGWYVTLIEFLTTSHYTFFGKFACVCEINTYILNNSN